MAATFLLDSSLMLQLIIYSAMLTESDVTLSLHVPFSVFTALYFHAQYIRVHMLYFTENCSSIMQQSSGV